MNAVLVRIAELYAAGRIADDGMLTGAAAELRRLAAVEPAADRLARLPVCASLPAALAAAGQGPLAALAEAFAVIEPMCRWRQNANYAASAVGAGFLDRYGYVELVGRGAPWVSARFAVGFLLLAPGTHYPLHQHPAAEVYHVVAGTAHWRRGDEPGMERAPGAVIHHPPHVPHEMRTGAEPLLALYCWSGEIGTAARLTSDRA